jgi:hypothetical protein
MAPESKVDAKICFRHSVSELRLLQNVFLHAFSFAIAKLLLKTIFGIHLKFRRHFEFLKKLISFKD